MSPFITFRDNNKDGDLVTYICQRDFPHFCAALSYIPVLDAIACVPVSKHNIWLVSAGTIRGGGIYPSYPDAQQMFQTTLWQMSEWFYLNRIVPDPKRYKKFLIQAT